MVDFICNLTGLRDAQTTGETPFLSVFLNVFLEEISIWFNRLSKEDSPSPMGRKRPRRSKLPLHEVGYPSSATSLVGPSGSRLLDSDSTHQQLSWSCSLQMADSGAPQLRRTLTHVFLSLREPNRKQSSILDFPSLTHLTFTESESPLESATCESCVHSRLSVWPDSLVLSAQSLTQMTSVA